MRAALRHATKQPKKVAAEPVNADDGLPARGTVHWDGPVPSTLDDSRVQSIPYRSRKGELKVAVHWGQRKLLMSELQLLLPPYADGFKHRYHIVYVGSAPGSHLPFLDGLFDHRHTWQLVDPGEFDVCTRGHPNIQIDNCFCDNAFAYGIATARLCKVAPALGAVFGLVVEDAETGADVERPWRALATGDLDAARTSTAIPTMAEPELALPVGIDLLRRAASERSPLLFVSDVRSGTAEMPNFSAHVVENMTAQATWSRIIDPSCALLKYRLPYTSDPAKLAAYPRGDVLLPIWGPLTTTECRLATRHAFGWAPQDSSEHERRMFYINAVLRERVHFDHALSPHPDLDNRFDSAAEVFIWESFRAAGGMTKGTVAELVSATTKALGETFEDVRRKRDHLLTTAAPVQGGTLKRYRPEERHGASTSTVSLAALLAERRRPVWWANREGRSE